MKLAYDTNTSADSILERWLMPCFLAQSQKAFGLSIAFFTDPIVSLYR